AVRSGGDQEAEAVRWPASEEPCVAAGTRKLKPCGGRLRREPCVAAGTRKLKPCGGRLRREPRTCGCGVTARAHIHVRTRYRGHPWPLPRHTRTSTASACLCLLTCRSRSCRRPRRGVVCRDAAACIAVAGKAGSYTNECSAQMRGARTPLPSQTKPRKPFHEGRHPAGGMGQVAQGRATAPSTHMDVRPRGAPSPRSGDGPIRSRTRHIRMSTHRVTPHRTAVAGKAGSYTTRAAHTSVIGVRGLP